MTMPLPEVLQDIREGKEAIEGRVLATTVEIRKRVLPAIVALERRTYRKTPGYHESLASIGLTASTVRSWFRRGWHTGDLIKVLEKAGAKRPVHKARKKLDPPVPTLPPIEDARELLLQQADKAVAAFLKGNLALATKLGREYLEARNA